MYIKKVEKSINLLRRSVLFIVLLTFAPMVTHAYPAGTSSWDDWDGDGSTWTSGDDFGDYDSGHGGCCDSTLGGGSNDDHGGGGTSGTGIISNGNYTSTQQGIIDAAAQYTDAEILAMSTDEILALPPDQQVAAQIARAEATGRDVTYYSNGTIVVESCSNGMGGTWTMDTPSTIYAQSSYGSTYSQSSYTTCTGNSCPVSAELEALAEDEPYYAAASRSVAPNKKIYLRWRGLNGATSCTGIVPDDFTGASHPVIGSLEAPSVHGPYLGLAPGGVQRYTVECRNAAGQTAQASLELNAICSVDCAPPTITIDKPIVRYGEEVVITWDPVSVKNTACTLSPQISAGNNANAVGNTTYTVTGETTFSITCNGGTAEVSVKVLPRVQET